MDQKKGYSKDFYLVVIGQIISLFGNAVMRFAAHPSAERDGISGRLRRGVRMRVHSPGGDVTNWRDHSG